MLCHNACPCIGTRAEHRVEAAYINDLKRVAGKARILYCIADAVLEHPDDLVREVVFPVASEQTLRDLVAEYKAQGGAYRQQVQQVMRSSYRNHYRQILPALLDVLAFRSNNTAYQPVIQALAVVREYVDSQLAWYPLESSPPLEGVIPSAWASLCHSPKSPRSITSHRTAPHLSTLRLQGFFLNAGPTITDSMRQMSRRSCWPEPLDAADTSTIGRSN